MRLYQKIILAIIFIILVIVARLLINAGVFREIKPHFNGKITQIGGFDGGEDITIDQETGLAFISSNEFFKKEAKNGTIFTLNLNDPSPKPLNISKNLPFDFHPHGISLYKSADGEKSLFVVNHRKEGNFIEIFEIKDSSLVHKESISHPLIISPNDIVAVGERSFYVTNDHDEPLSQWRANKDLMQIPMGNVCYYDGKNARIVADGFLYANGINANKEGTKVYVAATTGGKIMVYDRNIETGDLVESDEIAIHGADNIEVDAEGNLWIGCHVNLLAFLEHSKDQTKLSPSEIIKISYQGKDAAKLESVYLNDGRPVSGSSVGAVYKNKLLIGTVFEDKILLGEME
ncbi:MAG: SMP-30/gluconolactonase/LRE family protein [Bacteroidota bacterium]